MDPHRAHAHNTLTTSLTAWQHFLDRALLNRLDPARFAALLPIHFGAHPLPPALVADVLLRPPPAPQGCYRLDPRVLLYLQALLRQRWVDMAGVLRGLFVYSSAQRWVGGEEGEDGEDGEGEQGGGASTTAQTRRAPQTAASTPPAPVRPARPRAPS